MQKPDFTIVVPLFGCVMLAAVSNRAAAQTTPAKESTPTQTQPAAVEKKDQPTTKPAAAPEKKELTMADRVKSYATVRLTTDMKNLSESEKKMIPLLIEAAEQMDKIYWLQTYGDKEKFLASISDPAAKRFAEINYGPWDRLGNDKPFLPDVKPKPAGANFYPTDLTKAAFEEYVTKNPTQAEALKSQYTVVRKDEKTGALTAIPYHEFFKEPTQVAAKKLKEAAALAEDPGLKKYLELRSEALLKSDFKASDEAWLDMKNNGLDIVIGPIENYEDKLFGYKTAHEAFVLVKDKEWSKKLAKYAAFLPDLQNSLPVLEDAYKAEKPGTNSDLNAYDVIYYAGDCNAGAKTIAINLPNDEKIQTEKGSRRLQLKNAMKAKFDNILTPIAKELIVEDQLKHVNFDAFFANTMFHEVAHGLGIKRTVDGKSTVREALKDRHAALEEGKADVLGLFMVGKLRQNGEITEGDIKDNYVTFLAGILRSVRFGASSAHGQANSLTFNFFKLMGAFTRDSQSGKYRVNFDRFPEAVEGLSQTILMYQGKGDYNGTGNLMSAMGTMGPELQSDLERLQKAGIPVDVVFEQGMAVIK